MNDPKPPDGADFAALTAAFDDYPSQTAAFETFGDMTVGNLADATRGMTVGEVAKAYPTVQALAENAPTNSEEN